MGEHKLGWSGYWPTNEYPSDGTLIRYTKHGEVRESRIEFVWCGIEPAIKMENGDTIFPTLDTCEVVRDE